MIRARTYYHHRRGVRLCFGRDDLVVDEVELLVQAPPNIRLGQGEVGEGSGVQGTLRKEGREEERNIEKREGGKEERNKQRKKQGQRERMRDTYI